MRIFLDFEATQPEQEIISIGACSDNHRTFYEMVKPQFSTVSKYITEMTGITNEDLETAYDLDTALDDLFTWCYNQESNITKWHFYSYGEGDVDFLKHSLCNVKSQNSLIIASLIIATMQDYSKQVFNYFRGTTSLIKAFNYFKDLDNKQKHNALEDAEMLADVFMKINEQNPLDTNPFIEKRIEEINYTFPSGKFYCKSTGKNAKEREFYSIHEAMEWLIDLKIAQKDREMIRRDKMAAKIMKAVRKKDTYMQYLWRREK